MMNGHVRSLRSLEIQQLHSRDQMERAPFSTHSQYLILPSLPRLPLCFKGQTVKRVARVHSQNAATTSYLHLYAHLSSSPSLLPAMHYASSRGLKVN